MNTFDVKIRVFNGDTSTATNLEVIARTSYDAVVSGLKALELENARVSVFVSPVKGVRK